MNRAFLAGNGEVDGTHPLIGDGAALPLSDGCVDTVVATEVLEHVPSDVKMISEVSRVLKPGGRFIITVPNAGLCGFLDPNHFGPARVVLKIIGKESQPLHRHYSLDDLRALLKDDFIIEYLSRTGCWVTGICVLLVQFSKLVGSRRLESLFNTIGAHDYQLEYGAGAYNLAVSARKAE